MRQKVCGFTLLELLMTTVLMAMLLSIGIPSLSAMAARQRQHTEINALFHAVHSARKESIMRRKVVSICPSSDGRRCGPRSAWSDGWLMFENGDRDSPPQLDKGEALLRHHRVDESVIVQANRSGFTLRATVRRATNGTVIFCDVADRVQPRALVISYTGRPRATESGKGAKSYQCSD